MVFQLSQDGWAPIESKVAAIVEWLAPETVKHLRSFLGMDGFFRTFVPVYSEMASPLNEFLKSTNGGSQNLEWSVACQTAFMGLKAALTSAPALRHFDPVYTQLSTLMEAKMQWGQFCSNGRRV